MGIDVSVLSIILNDAICVSYDLVFKHLWLVLDQVYKLTKAFVTKTYLLKSKENKNIKNREAWFLLPLICTVVVYNAWNFHDDRCISFRVRAILLMQKVHFFSFLVLHLKNWQISTASSYLYLDQRHSIELLALNFILTFTSSTNCIKITSIFRILWKK